MLIKNIPRFYQKRKILLGYMHRNEKIFFPKNYYLGNLGGEDYNRNILEWRNW